MQLTKNLNVFPSVIYTYYLSTPFIQHQTISIHSISRLLCTCVFKSAADETGGELPLMGSHHPCLCVPSHLLTVRQCYTSEIYASATAVAHVVSINLKYTSEIISVVLCDQRFALFRKPNLVQNAVKMWPVLATFVLIAPHWVLGQSLSHFLGTCKSRFRLTVGQPRGEQKGAQHSKSPGNESNESPSDSTLSPVYMRLGSVL